MPGAKLVRDAGSCAGGAGGRRVPNQMVNIIFELGPAHLEFIDFLIGGEIDFFLDAIDRVVEPVIFVKHSPEVIIGAFEAPDDFAMLRKIPEDRMMEIHSLAVETAKLIVRLIHLLRPYLRSSEYPIQKLEQVKLLFR